MKYFFSGKIYGVFIFLFLLALSSALPCAYARDEKAMLKLEIKGSVISGVPFTLEIKAIDENGGLLLDFNDYVKINATGSSLMIEKDGKLYEPDEYLKITGGILTLEGVVLDKPGKGQIDASAGDLKGSISYRALPGVLSILPPLLAILLALTLRQVVVSLFFGIWLGAIFIYNFNPFTALFRLLDTLMIKAIATESHVAIIVFSLFLGGMVAVISGSGGNQGLVEIIKKRARSPRSGQLATWLLGIIIFFDDYANTLIVGNSMRPLTDKLKISREKLSFIVDATAAPVTSIAVISTWIGFEISVIAKSLQSVGLHREPYILFVQSIPYRFYPILLLIFIFFIAYMLRDFGPMLAAELRTRKTGEVMAPGAEPLSSIDTVIGEPDKKIPRRWYNAIVPILSMIIFTMIGLYFSGKTAIAAEGGTDALKNARLYDIIKYSDSFQVLIWASFGGSVVAILMVLVQKIMNLDKAVCLWIEGAKSLMPAVVILCLAWTIGDICDNLHTGGYVSQIARGNIPPQMLPFTIFILSSIISFATGTSWGTMTIVMPIAVAVSYHLPPADMAESMKNVIMLGSISGVLAGATFGDHCSPISDTTIMSSMASACDHIDHVKTQMPYTLVVAIVGAIFGLIPSGYGLNPFISMAICSVILYLIVRLAGKKTD